MIHGSRVGIKFLEIGVKKRLPVERGAKGAYRPEAVNR